MNVSKFLRTQPFRIRMYKCTHTQSKSIQNNIKSNENMSFNKNSLLVNYVKESSSNKHYLQLPDVFNFWLKVPQDKLQEIRAALDYVLQGILLLDDVQDGTQYRRALPSANRVYGVPLAVNASIFSWFAGFEKLLPLRNPATLSVYCEQLLTVLDGIALDIYRRDTFICPTEDEYIEIIKNKTTPFFMLNLALIQALSEDRRDYRELINAYGLYYQVRDDYTNLVNVKAVDTKSSELQYKDLHHFTFCEDITEGRFTWPLIHGLNSSEGPTIRSILVQHTNDIKIKQHCLSLLEKVGSLEYTRQTLLDLDANLRDQIHRLGGNPLFIAYLDEMSNWK